MASIQTYQRQLNCSGFDLFFMKKPDNLGKIKAAARLWAETYISGSGQSDKVVVTIEHRQGDPSSNLNNFRAKCVITVKWPKDVKVMPIDALNSNREAWSHIPGYTGSELYLSIPV